MKGVILHSKAIEQGFIFIYTLGTFVSDEYVGIQANYVH